MNDGAMLVDHTTARPKSRAKCTRAAKARRVGFLDAPVSGGQAGAENGKLTIMVGGDPAVFAKAEPVLAHYARAVTLMGRPGSGPAHEDGQPDLHRRTRAGARPKASTSRSARASIPSACSTSSARAPRNRGRWKTAARRWSPTSSISASPSTGCARTWHLPRRSARATARRCRSPRSSTSSTRACRRAAAAAGIRRA